MPPSYSARQPLAKVPSWISFRIFFISALVASVSMGAGDQIAPFGGVADAVAHVVEAALVDQVDDQLHLVDALEVRHLRRVARLDERLEARLDQRRQAAAEDDLFAEQVGLAL